MLDITKLLEPDCYDHPVGHIELIETHISWVILTGSFAYKIKKPINLGFLDFSSLERRHHYCDEELRLNRRLALQIYLSVEPLRGGAQSLHFGGDGEIIDYAVKMRQFPQEAQFDRLLKQNKLQASYLDAIADMVARFHLTAETADQDSEYGQADEVWEPIEENFRQIQQRTDDLTIQQGLERMSRWCRAQFQELAPVLGERKRAGFIRECHGDLHLRNIAWFENRPIIFDCIEFSPKLRWIDVMSDLAFLFMDLIDRKQVQGAYRVLNHYLERTGDYAGLAVLPFYSVYRAMVRAKVTCIRLSQQDIHKTERLALEREFKSYLTLAESFIQRPCPALMITWGLSASGKSTVSAGLMQRLHAIRLRSDVERKRLAGLDADIHRRSQADTGIYTTDMTDRTYGYLQRLAVKILTAGYSVIVDATFLESGRRQSFQDLAKQRGLPFIILQCVASATCLRRRICQRDNDVSDADLSILENQLSRLKPLSLAESREAVIIDTEHSIDWCELIKHILGKWQDNNELSCLSNEKDDALSS